MNIALLGNPNCGKTTLFNLLTGSFSKVGNWAGVTTDKKEGLYLKNKNIKIIDLPGIYSLNAESKDEQSVVEFLKETPPNVIINVIDGCNLERGLYLTGLISELKIPMLIAVNFSDELQKKGVILDEKKLSAILGIEVIKISALKNINIDFLMKKALKIMAIPKTFFSGNLQNDYAFLAKTVKSVLVKKEKQHRNFSEKADLIFTGKFTAIPMFCAVMVAVYFLSLKIGGLFGAAAENFFLLGQNNLSVFLSKNDVPPWIVGLLCDAVIKGIGTVLSFLPQVLILFLLLTLLEESGYMARVSFIMDRIFKKFGLGGKSVIPFALSCGCTVTGIMATRTISDKEERKRAIYLCPFMPCGAKCAVFGWFSFKFFNGSAFIAVAMYFLGIFTAAAVGLILNDKKEKNGFFLLEMPDYRRPPLKTVYGAIKEKIKEFIIKSGTVIFFVSVVLWVLKSFGLSGYVDNQIDKSFLFFIGNILKYLFYPLGFCDYKAAISLICGIFAKEAVIETAELLNADFYAVFGSGYSVFAFMSFILLSPPCMAALSAAKKELNVKDFFFMIFLQFTVAYAVAFLINTTGIILSRKSLIFSVVSFIIIITLAAFFIKNRVKSKCFGCGKKVCKKCKKPNTTI